MPIWVTTRAHAIDLDLKMRNRRRLGVIRAVRLIDVKKTAFPMEQVFRAAVCPILVTHAGRAA